MIYVLKLFGYEESLVTQVMEQEWSLLTALCYLQNISSTEKTVFVYTFCIL